MAKDLTWVSVEVDTMPKAMAAQYAKLKAAQAAAATARAEFEEAFIKAAREKGALEPTDTLAFGYRFGKLAVAKTQPKTAAKPKGPTFRF